MIGTSKKDAGGHLFCFALIPKQLLIFLLLLNHSSRLPQPICMCNFHRFVCIGSVGSAVQLTVIIQINDGIFIFVFMG